MSDLRPWTGQAPGETTSRAGRLDRVLTDLLAQAPEIEAAAVVSFDGLPMVSALPPTMDEDRVAAMSAALLSLGERAAEGLGRGELSQVYIEGESGTVFLISCDNEAVLVAVAAAGAKAGLMLYEVRRAAAGIAGVLREDEPVPAPAPMASAPPAPLAPVPDPLPDPLPEAMPQPAAEPAPALPSVHAASAALADFPPLHAVAGEQSGAGYGTPTSSNGWSSYAPGGAPPSEPTNWS